MIWSILAHLAHSAHAYFSFIFSFDKVFHKSTYLVLIFSLCRHLPLVEKNPFDLETVLTKVNLTLSGKKSKSVFDFLTYSRETGFSFSYGKVGELIRLIGPSDEIDRVSKFDNSLSFGAKQNALRQIFYEL